jgi:hypothetical protein
MAVRPRSVSTLPRGYVSKTGNEDPTMLARAAAIYKLIEKRDKSLKKEGVYPSVFYTKDTPVPEKQ